MPTLLTSLFRRALIYSLTALQLLQPLAAYAQTQTVITPDQSAAANHKPVVAESANHTPVENIAAPSAGGVSHNALTDLQVGPEGLVVNNSGNNGVSNIGGVVLANPNIHSGNEAKIIVNEVTGTNATNQEGYTEIFGKAAEYIVANPNGISCNGCGYINTPKVVMTTGKPGFDAHGNVTSFEVKQGTITIGGEGMDASATDSVEIISRAAQINATIWGGKSLNITAGRNHVDYATGTATPLPADAASEATKPTVAIDASQLGSMYAGKITLKSTEAGVGVNSLGEMVATSGDLGINADGSITYGTAQAANDVHITSQQGSVSQKTGAYAGKSITIQAKGPVDVAGHYVYADGGDVTINSDDNVSLDGTEAGDSFAFLMANHVSVNAGGDVLFSQVTSSSQEQSIALNAAKTIDLDTSTLIADNLTLNAGLTANAIDSVIVAQQDISLAAAGFATSNSTLLAAHDLTMQVSGDWQNNQGVVTSQHQTQIHAGGTLVNNGELSAQDILNIQAGDITNALDGYMAANGDVQLNGASFLNHGQVQTLGTLTITASGDVTLTGSLMSLGQTTLTAHSIVNQGGAVQAGGTLHLSSHAITNSSGLFYSEGDVNADTTILLNDGGEWAALGTTTLDASSSITNQHQGIIRSDGGLVLLSQGEIDNSATLVSSGLLSLGAATLAQSGTLYTLGGILVTISGDTTNSGTIQSEQGVTLHSQTLNNTGSVIASTLLDVSAADLINSQNGLFGSLGDLTVQANTMTNTLGTFYTEGFLALTANELDNTQGTIIASGAAQAGHASQLNIDGTLTNNQGTISIAHDLTMNANSVDNSNGTIVTNGSFIATADSFNNQYGITSVGTHLTAHNVDNRNGLMEAGGTVEIVNDTRFENQGGIVQSYGSNGNGLVWISASEDINNQGGTILAAGGINLAVDNDYTITGDVQSSGTVDITAHHITNSGSLQSQGSVVFHATGAIENQAQASLLSNDTIDLTATGDILNYGEISSANGLNLTTGGVIINGLDALMTTGGSLAFNAGSALINQGRVSSLLDASLTATNIMNNGQISSGGSVTMKANNITNTSLVYASQHLNLLTENQLLNDQGTLAALNGTIAIHNAAGGNVGEVDNLSGTIQSYNGDIAIHADSLVNKRKSLTFDTVTITDPLHTFSLQDDLIGAEMLPDTPENRAYKEAHSDHIVLLYQGDFWSLGLPPYNNTNYMANTMLETVYYDDLGSAGTWVDGYFTSISVPLNTYVGDPASTKDWYVTYVNDLTISDTVGVQMSHIEEAVTSDTGASQIIAGNNLSIHASSILNDASILASGNNMDLAGTTLVNKGYELSKTDRITCTYQLACSVYHPEDGLFFGLNIIDSGSQIDLATGIYKKIPALMTAGGSITGDFSDRIDTISIIENAALTNYYPSPGVTDYHNANPSSASSQTDMNDYIHLPQGQNGLFVVNSSTGALAGIGRLGSDIEGASYHTYDGQFTPRGLAADNENPGFTYEVETNVDYINVDAYLGSEYLLNLIGFNPDHMITLLGDPFYETNLIEQAVMNKLGKRFISSALSNSTEQMQYLMDNAATAMVDLELVPGVALSSEQLASLNTDIIWPVQQVINNKVVWVPTLYLSANTLAGIDPSGSVISSNHAIQLSAGNNINNIGSTISGGSFVGLTSVNGSILNKTNIGNVTVGSNKVGYLGGIGSITSGGSMLLNAGHDIQNVGGILTAQDSLYALAGNDISLESTHIENDYTWNGQKLLGEHDSTVNLSSQTGAGGNMILLADNTISVSGSMVGAQGTLAMQAGGDVNITSAEDYSHNDITYKRYHHDDTSTTQVSSIIQAGGDLAINAINQGSTINVAGSVIGSGGSISLSAVDDITIGSTLNESDDHTKTSAKGFLSSMKSSVDKVNTWQTGSLIAATGDLTITSGSDVNLTASKLTAGHNLGISAGIYKAADGTIYHDDTADITIQGAENTSYLAQMKKQSGLSASVSLTSIGVSYQASKDTLNQYTETILPSELLAGNDLNMMATDDITLQGSHINAGHDINLTAGDDINILSQAYDNDYKETHKTSSIGVTASLSFGAAGALGAVERLADIQATGSYGAVNIMTTGVSSVISIAHSASGLADALSGDHTDFFGPGGGFTSFIPSLNVSLGVSSSSSKFVADGTNYLNSDLIAGHDINTISGGDTTIKGGNILAQNISMDVGDDLNVESSQNVSHSSSSSTSGGASIGVNISVTGITPTASANFSASNGNSDRIWTDHITSIIGTDSVAIHVNGNTDIKGALIAQATPQENGTLLDGGNLLLETGSLTVSDLIDKNISENSGFGIGLSVSGDLVPFSNGSTARSGGNAGNAGNTVNSGSAPQPTDSPNNHSDQVGSSDVHFGGGFISASLNGHETVGYTHPTIGNGDIIIAGQSASDEQLSGVNRDVTTTQQIVIDKDTGGLNAYVTLDPRLFTAEGRDQIIKEIESLPQNAETIYNSGTVATLNHFALDIIPTKTNNGGILGQIVALVEGDLKYISVSILGMTPERAARFNRDKEAVKIVTDSDGKKYLVINGTERYEVETHEYTLEEIKNDPSITESNKVFNNGMLNPLDQALRNGFMQLGAPGDFILAYDPTHGLLPDLLEVGINKFAWTIPNSMDALALDHIILDNNPDADPSSVVFASHSAGGESLYNQLMQAEFGTFSGSTVLFYGTPQNTADLENAATLSGANFGGHQINPGDPIAVIAGGNFTNVDNFVDGLKNVPFLFFSSYSPHSNYYCTNALVCP
ncbi:MAG: hemagglutinin repeat-containing protein [Alphaproteobacteria bacterium]|nr:hemagglutinin repeat-containing protein [Alphaproteobacteria bacterium]